MTAETTDRTKYNSDWYSANKERHLKNTHARHREGKVFINSLKEKIPCSDCGGVFHPCAMDWHHRDRSNKILPVSHMRGHSKEKILEEISKCELVCSNCHRIRHAGI